MWTAQRKLEIVDRIRNKRDENVLQECQAHGISLEELTSWLVRFEQFGLNGLKCTKIQQYR